MCLTNKLNLNNLGLRKIVDEVFVLKSLVKKYANNKKQKVFGCFVDLKKAFDSVWRSGLLYKIIKNENVGNFFL